MKKRIILYVGTMFVLLGIIFVIASWVYMPYLTDLVNYLFGNMSTIQGPVSLQYSGSFWGCIIILLGVSFVLIHYLYLRKGGRQ